MKGGLAAKSRSMRYDSKFRRKSRHIAGSTLLPRVVTATQQIPPYLATDTQPALMSATERKATVNPAAQALEQVKRYQQALRWLISDAYGRYARLSISAALLMFLGLLLKMASLGLLSKYLHLLETKQPFRFKGFVVDQPASSYELLVVVAAVVSVMFLGACISQYLSELKMLRLGTLYEERCLRRAIIGIGRYGEHPRIAQWRPAFKYILASDPRFSGTVARLGLRLLSPAVTGLITFALLVYLAPLLTLSLAALVLLAIPLLFRASLRGASQSRNLERNTPLANMEKRRLIKAVGELETDSSPPSAILNTPFENGPLRRTLDAYMGRLRASVDSTLITSALMAVAVFVLLIQQGADLLNQGVGWGQFATYLLVLRLCLGSFTQGAGILAGINRLYPQMSRFMNFCIEVNRLEKSGEPYAPAAKSDWAKARSVGEQKDDDIFDEDL